MPKAYTGRLNTLSRSRLASVGFIKSLHEAYTKPTQAYIRRDSKFPLRGNQISDAWKIYFRRVEN